MRIRSSIRSSSAFQGIGGAKRQLGEIGIDWVPSGFDGGIFAQWHCTLQAEKSVALYDLRSFKPSLASHGITWLSFDAAKPSFYRQKKVWMRNKLSDENK